LLTAHASDQLNQDRHLMIIVASERQTVPPRADLLAATAALAQMFDGSLELNQSSTINKL
jgi:hypothetical protein